MSQAIDWELTERVAAKVAGKDPLADSYLTSSLEPDFQEFTTLAQGYVEAEVGFSSLAGEARAKVVDRMDWVRANVASHQRLLRPLLNRMEEIGDSTVSELGGKFAAVELGALLGWMSTRVLGQYDLLVIEEENPEDQDLVYYVGPNILSLEKRYAFPPREFRFWVALHEVTHRTQFTGVPWLREYFLGLVNELIDSTDPDPKRFFTAVGRAAESLRKKENPLNNGGMAALLASETQQVTMDKVGGLMSLLEGHGDVTMDRAAADKIPSQQRFAQVIRQRRSEQKFFASLLQKMIGLEAKLAQYQQGEEFIAAVEDVGGKALLNRAFEDPANLPTLEEIREPKLWLGRIERVQLELV